MNHPKSVRVDEPFPPRQKNDSNPGRCILVACSGDADSTVPLRRAQALARIFDARLLVVNVLTHPAWIARFRFPLFSQSSLSRKKLLEEADRITSFCERVLGTSEQPAIVLKVGDVGRALLEAADEFRPLMTVLGGSAAAREGELVDLAAVVRILLDAGRPVFLARPERRTGRIVAATNFSDPSFPALSQAARLGARLCSHVTFVHNVNPECGTDAEVRCGLPLAQPPVATQEGVPATDLERRRRTLDDLASGLGEGIDAVVLSEKNAADAILSVAERREADLVVLGSRGRGIAKPSTKRGTAFDVALHAGQSVLTVPMH